MIRPEIDWGAPVTNPTYQFYDTGNVLLGSPVTGGVGNGLSNSSHFVWPSVQEPTGAIGIMFTCAEYDPAFGNIENDITLNSAQYIQLVSSPILNYPAGGQVLISASK